MDARLWSTCSVVSMVLGFAVCFFASRAIYNVLLHPLRCVPGPPFAKISRLWLFWYDYGGNPHTKLLELHRKLGPLVRISPNEVSINDISTSSTIYAQSNEPWVKAQYHYKAFQSSTAYSIFTELDPGVHAKHLKLLNPSFSHAKVARSQPLLYSYSAKLIQQMRIRTQAHEGDRGVIGLSDAFRSFALDVVTDWTFGRSTNCMDTFESPMFEMFETAAESVIYFQHIPLLRYIIPWLSPLFPRLVPNKMLGLYANEAIRKITTDTSLKSSHSSSDNVVSNVLSLSRKTGYPISPEQLISDAIVILAAGADTTAAALAIGLHHLARDAELWDLLRDELRGVLSPSSLVDDTPNSQQPNLDVLARLPVLNAILREGLRLTCPIRGHMPRVVPQGGWEYKGVHFPAGTVVAMSALYGCYDQRVFPHPERYDPRRWLVDDTSEMDRYLQIFSRGTRQCIGQNLALAMQRIAISQVVSHFRPCRVDDCDIKTREYVSIILDSPLSVEIAWDPVL